MKNSSLLTLSLATVLGLSACGFKTASDVKKDVEKQIADDKKKNEEVINSIKLSFEQGGQPGVIKVSGIVVKDDSTADVRITVISKGGTGKDGTEVKVADANKPVLASKNEKLDLSKVSEMKNLIALGCDEKTTADLANERSLEVQPVPAPMTKDLMSISAKTIVLCGKMADTHYPFLGFEADELVLNQVDYTQTEMSGWVTFSANKLMLLGANQITVRGVPSSATLSLAPTMTFNVLKEISSSEDGKLVLSSIGSDYKAEAK